MSQCLHSKDESELFCELREQQSDELKGKLGPDRPEETRGNLSSAMKMDGRKNILRKIKACCSRPKLSTVTIFKRVESNPALTEVDLDFQENLKQNRLVEACQQLLLREDQIFNQETVMTEESGGVCIEDEKDSLHKDYEKLLLHLELALHDTFSSTASEQQFKILQSAVEAIMLQEQQDERWEKLLQASQKPCPEWRPYQCMLTHNAILKEMVKSRINNAAEDNVSVSSADRLSTSLKREVFLMGKRLKEDILKVVNDVRGCYPADFDVCNIYMRFYHQAFSARLTEIAQSELDAEDCAYVLYWVNNYYPSEILKDKDLEGQINGTSLGCLLSKKDLKILEEQYLLYKEVQVQTWVSKALSKEEESWRSGKMPDLTDNYYFCHLAIDVIQIVNGAMTEARTVLSAEDNARRFLSVMDSFLKSFKTSLEECMKGRRENCQAVVKANLFSIEEFRNFILKEMSGEVMARSLSALTELEDAGYGYFTQPIHEELKMHYRRLWTRDWFTCGHRVLDDVMEILDRHIQQLTDLNPICMEKLLGRLHVDITVEYVRRMMKRKMRLKEMEQQTAANMLLTDSNILTNFFTEAGSKRHWLRHVLEKMAEVVKLQDTGSVHLEIIALAMDYPDISCSHISALLYLKANLSKNDVSSIKKSLEENRLAITPLNTNPPFFSKVRAGKMWNYTSK
ncbi:hypothetical protein UPYG_G00350610 [Umbra pygmaea]|uniref:Tumor necrosis factor alpha-induced protein 2 n=1 Tax=Umbra pygmaea TaxID=75934 RepID=A0ABD0VYF6_UMBPY